MMMFPTFAADAYADDASARHERTEKCERAWKAYRGDLPKPLKVKAFDDNVQPPFAQVVVDVGVGFLFGKPPSWEVHDAALEGAAEDAAELETSPDEQWLDDALDANDIDALLLRLGIAGGVTGHAMLKIQPVSPLTAPYPRVIILDHATVDVSWEADDIDNIFRFVQRWRDIDRRTGKAVSRRQVTERADSGAYWTILDQQSPADGGRWTDLGPPARWNFPFPPIVHAQNLPAPHEFWGLSDLEKPLVDLQRALSFLLSNLQKTVRLTAHPKPYGTGIDASKVDASPDALSGLPLGGELKYMQADPFQAPSLELFRELKSALHEVAQIPEVATGKLDNVGQLSGLALQILYGPLLDKTARKRTTYGPLLERLGRAMLAAGGRWTGQEVCLVWQDPLPRNTVEQRTIATLDHQLGVSRDTLLTQLGYDAQVEADKRRQEAQDAIDAAQLAFDRGQGAQFGQTTPRPGQAGQGTQDTPSGGATA